MFEHRQEPLLPTRLFLFRQFKFFGLALLVVGVSLLIGWAGYFFFEGLAPLDALLNAAMILGGMGPVNALHSDAGKLFASFYALYSGMIFLVVAGILFAPAFHRILHHFHLEAGIED